MWNRFWSNYEGGELFDGYSYDDHVISLKSYIYGSAVTPVPRLISCYNEGVELIYGEDYTVSYTNNDAIGIGRVTITGIGNYQGTRSFTFTIECGHVYGDWIVDCYATPSSTGEQHRTCSSDLYVGKKRLIGPRYSTLTVILLTISRTFIKSSCV